MTATPPVCFVALPAREGFAEVSATIDDVLVGASIRREGFPPDTAITRVITDVLQRSDMMIADLTNLDANVLVEVGIALGLRKPLLLLTRDERIPTDIRHIQVIHYKPGDEEKLRSYLEFWVRESSRTPTSTV